MSRIVSIGTAVPEHKHLQADILQFMLNAMPVNAEKDKRLLSSVFSHSGIESRYSVLPDFALNNDKDTLFHSNNGTPILEERMQVFEDEALKLSILAVKKCLSNIDYQSISHIITVTCTGMSAPGLDTSLVEQLGLNDDVERSSVNFMGCHGGFHAMKQAFYICNHNPNANVLIADVELSTIHFQKNMTTDNMLANTLFADGAAAMLVSGKESSNQAVMEISNFHSKIILKGKSSMAWKTSSNGFLMTLSTKVPELIGKEFLKIMSPIFKNDLSGINISEMLWAIHPGGIKILESISNAGGISKDQMWASYDVLKNFGNMSSCTIFFVLQQLMDEVKSSDKPVLALGFGPGLSMEIMIIKKGEHKDV